MQLAGSQPEGCAARHCRRYPRDFHSGFTNAHETELTAEPLVAALRLGAGRTDIPPLAVLIFVLSGAPLLNKTENRRRNGKIILRRAPRQGGFRAADADSFSATTTSPILPSACLAMTRRFRHLQRRLALIRCGRSKLPFACEWRVAMGRGGTGNIRSRQRRRLRLFVDSSRSAGPSKRANCCRARDASPLIGDIGSLAALTRDRVVTPG